MAHSRQILYLMQRPAGKAREHEHHVLCMYIHRTARMQMCPLEVSRGWRGVGVRGVGGLRGAGLLRRGAISPVIKTTPRGQRWTGAMR